MSLSAIDLAYLIGTLAVTALAVRSARSSPARGAAMPQPSKARRLVLWGAVGLVAYSLVRDFALAVYLDSRRIDPTTFVLLDLLSVVPYLLAAPRLLDALATKNKRKSLEWSAYLLFGMCVPGSYLAIVLSGDGLREGAWVLAVAAAAIVLTCMKLARQIRATRLIADQVAVNLDNPIAR